MLLKGANDAFVAHRSKGGAAKFFSALLVKVRTDIVHVMLNHGKEIQQSNQTTLFK
jgi:hypothetical protein